MKTYFSNGCPGKDDEMKNYEGIKNLTAEEFAKWLLSCSRCKTCAYYYDNVECNDCNGRDCLKGIIEYLEQEIKPPKTLADVFFERNPGAEKNVSGQPRSCAKHVGLISICPDTKCLDCWNIPYKESENE